MVQGPNIGSGTGFVPSDIKPLPETMLTNVGAEQATGHDLN